jgi:hypothetical protein
MIALGALIKGLPLGILIDERNKMTLSRLQIVLWTLVVLSALITVVLARVSAGVGDPWAVELPWQLWALMGISTTTLVGSPLIRSTKKQKSATNDAKRKMLKLQELKEKKPKTLQEIKMIEDEIKKLSATDVDEKSKVYLEGIIHVNTEAKKAKFSNLFTGDEVGNSEHIDVAKVQNFFFTIIAVIGYSVAIFSWMISMIKVEGSDVLVYLGTTASFPALDESLIWILGISHAGYLLNKTVDHTETT